MQIHGFTKTTLLDFPEHVAATVFTGGCNFRCPFCHNGDLVVSPANFPLLSEQELLSSLEKRRGIVTGVCVTGGEPTLQPDLADFLRRIKDLGFLVKLDTNGYLPKVLEKLIQEQLLDYIAMDIKSSKERYRLAAGIPHLDLERIKASVSLIRSCGISYEFRTTVVKELHTPQDLEDISRWLDGCRAYYLQSYKESEAVLEKRFTSYSPQELEQLLKLVQKRIPHAALRGVDTAGS